MEKVYRFDNGSYCFTYFDGTTELNTELNINEISLYHEKIQIENGILFLTAEDKALIDNEVECKELRHQRENECFPIINRGKLWYDKLTTAQSEELSTWYNAWLDVTGTKVIPEKPTWIETE